MGSSSEEERLIQMVRDFIESATPKSTSSLHDPSDGTPETCRKLVFSNLQDVLLRVTNAENEILEKISIYLQREMEFSGQINNLKKWIVLRLSQDGFEASLCKTSWLAAFGRPSGQYEYIDVMMKGITITNGGTEARAVIRIIVDLDFRSQFELARPTAAYSELLSSLPAIFVGTEQKLMEVVSLLCSAAKQSLRERGLHIPPWRKASYVQSKWLSENCKKVTFSL